MRIALFSPHFAYNYGAVLQAFALKTYLRAKGHDAVILNRRPQYHCAIPSFTGRLARKLEELSKADSFGKFESNYLQPQTPPIIFQSDWSKFEHMNFDAIIVGSDQIWRDDYAFNSFGFNLFLDFINDNHTLRIAYAPSLGKESWNAAPEVEAKVKDLLQKFDAISVRESSSIEILKLKFNVDSTLVVDPTMLLLADEYKYHLNLTMNNQQQYIAAYILDYNNTYRTILDTIATELSMPIRKISVKKSTNKLVNLVKRFLPMKNVIKWVGNIANAEYVITNSFHGMVFSVIFRKQFVVFMNSERGSARFKSFLKMFGLENRLTTTSDNNYLNILNNRINYSSEIELSIEKWRKHSEEYLNKSLQPK